MLEQALADEKEESVREVLLSLATFKQNTDPEIRRQSVTLLSGSLDPDVRNLLTELLQKDPSGNWNEPSQISEKKSSYPEANSVLGRTFMGGLRHCFLG